MSSVHLETDGFCPTLGIYTDEGEGLGSADIQNEIHLPESEW